MPTDIREIFRSNLNELMERRDVSQADISRDLGIPQATVSSWCVGTKFPRIDIMQRLADYLGVNISALTKEDGMQDAVDMDRLEAMHQNPKLGLLFDRTRKMSSADVEMMLALSERITGENDK